MRFDWETVDYEAFSNLLTSRMREKDISPSEVANELGVSPRLMSMALSGSRRMSSRKNLEMAQFLKINSDEIPILEPEESKAVSKGTKIFVSYSHKDNVYLERLMVHLKPLEKQGLIDPWVDTKLQAGESGKKKLKRL